MNLILLVQIFGSLPLRSRFRFLWVGALALSTLSLQMQVVTLLGAGTIRSIQIVNLGILIAVLCLKSYRLRLRSLCRQAKDVLHAVWDAGVAPGPILARCAFAVVVCVLCMSVARALFFIPFPADPYHLMKLYHIEDSGTLSYVSAIDYRINCFGYLYELILADIRTIPVLGYLLFRLVNPIFFGSLFFLVFALYRRNDARRENLHLWLGFVLVPVFLHHFFLLKNDYLTFLFGFVSMYLMFLMDRRLITEQIVLSGLFAGLSFSVKPTTFPLAVVAIMFLPYVSVSRFLRIRIVWGIAGLAGILFGGFVFVSMSNLGYYGDLVGPLSGAIGRWQTEGWRDSFVSIARFTVSLFNPGNIIPDGIASRIFDASRSRQWPTGGQLSWLFAVIVIVYCALVLRYKRGIRLGAMCYVYAISIAAVYGHLDIDHRRVMIPALLFMAEALSWLLTFNRKLLLIRVGKGLVAAAVVVSAYYAMSIVSSYLRQWDCLESMGVAAKLQKIDGDINDLDFINSSTAISKRFRRRALGRLAQKSDSTAYVMNCEYGSILEGVDYVPVLCVGHKDADGKFPVQWKRPKEYSHCDFFIVAIDLLPELLARHPDPFLRDCLPAAEDLLAITNCAEREIGFFCQREVSTF